MKIRKKLFTSGIFKWQTQNTPGRKIPGVFFERKIYLQRATVARANHFAIVFTLRVVKTLYASIFF